MRKKLPSIKELKKMYTYRDGEVFCRETGEPASRVASGRKVVLINGAYHQLSRVVWGLCKGKDPGGRNIGFLDGNCMNCCEENLVLGYYACRTKKTRANTSGFRGVHRSPNGKSWVSRIYAEGKLHVLGTYRTKKEAIAARVAAERKFGVAVK